MGRFDGPHFRDEDNDVVSVWVATCAFDEIPNDYFDEPFGDDDDEAPWNDFSSDFGFGYYDHDVIEPNHHEGKVSSVRDLILPCSYSSSFVDAAFERACELGLSETCFVFLMYNFRYDPEVTGKTESQYLKFIGVFAYDRNSGN